MFFLSLYECICYCNLYNFAYIHLNQSISLLLFCFYSIEYSTLIRLSSYWAACCIFFLWYAWWVLKFGWQNTFSKKGLEKNIRILIYLQKETANWLMVRCFDREQPSKNRYAIRINQFKIYYTQIENIHPNGGAFEVVVHSSVFSNINFSASFCKDFFLICACYKTTWIKDLQKMF